jgi:hypothetical protein
MLDRLRSLTAGFVHMRAAELIGDEGFLHPGDMDSVGLAEDDLDGTAPGIDPQELIRDHAGDPDLALGVEGEAVGKLPFAEFMHDLLWAETRAGIDREAAEPPAIGLVDIEPAPVGRDLAFIGEAETVGDDTRAALVENRDVTGRGIEAIVA